MEFKKVVRHIGDCVGIYFTRDEAKLHNIEVGDYLDLSDVVLIKNKKKKKEEVKK